jgi:hypothetical protein
VEIIPLFALTFVYQMIAGCRQTLQKTSKTALTLRE